MTLEDSLKIKDWNNICQLLSDPVGRAFYNGDTLYEQVRNMYLEMVKERRQWERAAEALKDALDEVEIHHGFSGTTKDQVKKAFELYTIADND